MYNRYIPQTDGTYRKNTVPERVPPAPMPRQQPQDAPPPEPDPIPPQEPPAPDLPPQPPLSEEPQPPGAPPCAPAAPQSAGSFLRNLIPQGLDTGDLFVIVMILLMAGDSQADNSSMLLTLALYLFL
ncbi:MAG: hypothetical protein LUH51_03830 [Firmicutes bacterium]|nr:hypothetical protein [Bacillota bacterium]